MELGCPTQELKSHLKLRPLGWDSQNLEAHTEKIRIDSNSRYVSMHVHTYACWICLAITNGLLIVHTDIKEF